MEQYNLEESIWNLENQRHLPHSEILEAFSLHYQECFKSSGLESLDSFKNFVFDTLKGNPTSSCVTFNLFVKPALKMMSGQKPNNTIIQARLDSDIHLDARPEYHRCTLGTIPSIFFTNTWPRTSVLGLCERLWNLEQRLFEKRRCTSGEINWISMLGEYKFMFKSTWINYCTAENRKIRSYN